MRKGILSVLAIWMVATTALAAEPEKAEKTEQATKAKVVAEQVEVTATVTAIDKATRAVTLKTADGKETTVTAPPEIKRFDQIKVGDTVRATYTVALAARINPTKGELTEPQAVVGAVRDSLQVAGAVGGVVTMNARVEAIDLKANTVTLKGAKGNTRTIAVKDPVYQEKLKNLKVGDIVEVAYAEALTLALEPAKK